MQSCWPVLSPRASIQRTLPYQKYDAVVIYYHRGNRGTSLFVESSCDLSPGKQKRKGRTCAIAVRRGSYKSLFLLNSGRIFPRKKGNSLLNFGSRKTV